MRRLLPALLAAGALAACGSETETTPLACQQGSGPFVEALAGGPGQVALAGPGGSARISDCLIPDQPAGDLSDVGQGLIGAATELNARALKDPAGERTTELGYLVGAVELGAEDTGGVHTDLVRRVNSAARYTADGDPPPAAFERAFDAGYAAGRESG